MSQLSEYSNLQCRWNWCRSTYSTIGDLLEHVREHVHQTEPCSVRDIPLLVRTEDGVGESLSVITMGFGSNQSTAQHMSIDPIPSTPLLSLPSQDIPSPIPHSPLRYIDFSSLPDTPTRSSKRRKLMSPGNELSRSRSASVQTPPRSCTPGFASLARPESAQPVPNPEFPDLDTLISNTLTGGVSAHDAFTTPNANGTLARGNPHSPLSDSDLSVERQLTQNFDTSYEGVLPNFGDSSQNLYTGELNWDDHGALTQNLPGSQSHTLSQSSLSQSQSQRPQQHSPASLMDVSPQLPLQRRQSWYQSPRRVSNPNKTPSGAAGQDVLGSTPTPSQSQSQPKPQTPAKTYLSGSLKITSPELPYSQPQVYGGAINPRVLQQSQYTEFSSQSQSQSPPAFFLQTQAQYHSQSMSQ
ncbi:hypothetical protein DFH08DRAFT_928639 [Mycena albidolilacea]|uniref:C2H2-type domain-containing protein n=1 Tax=Mycena albidolilacea TaxID=1033008 RepID=A0AAD7F4M5_9AGAR|nr:hypothetical protein DFH08DRAFT_928639 [Mycena albidolilacea]